MKCSVRCVYVSVEGSAVGLYCRRVLCYVKMFCSAIHLWCMLICSYAPSTILFSEVHLSHWLTAVLVFMYHWSPSSISTLSCSRSDGFDYFSICDIIVPLWLNCFGIFFCGYPFSFFPFKKVYPICYFVHTHHTFAPWLIQLSLVTKTKLLPPIKQFQVALIQN